jgi:hypothetical protein
MAAFGGHPNFLLFQQLQQLEDPWDGGITGTSGPSHHAAGFYTTRSHASTETGEGGPAPMHSKRQCTNRVEKNYEGVSLAESERNVAEEPTTRAPACLDSTPAHCACAPLCASGPLRNDV